MDGDLWDWPYDQGCCFSDADESSYSVESGWQADFYFGNGKDVIEENAMNEKYCVQVLKILIREADDDIDDLEKDLLLLQCDLAWTEGRNQIEACCNALREKIDILDGSIKSLRQSDKTNTDDQLPLHGGQPAEKFNEILKPLLGEGREQDDGQLVGPSCETSRISGVEVKSEEMEDNSLLLAVDTIPNGSVQKQKEDGNILDKEVKPEIAVEGVSSHALVTEENGCLKPETMKYVSNVETEEAKKCHISTTYMSRKLKSAANLVGARGLLKAQKQGKSVSENANPAVPRQSDGLSGNKRSFDPNLSSPARSKSGNCNVEEKLIDFLSRRKKNKSGEGSIVPESNGSASSCLSSNTKGKVDSILQVLETEEPGTFDTENFAQILLPKLQQGKDIAETKEIDKLLPEDSKNVENVSQEKSHLNVGHKPKALMEKGLSKVHTYSKAKKHRKPGAIGDNACLDPPSERKPQVKPVDPCQRSAEMQDDALDVENLGPLLLNMETSKMLVGTEFIDLSLVDDISSTDQTKPGTGTGEDKQMTNSRATTDDHSAETLAHLRSSYLKLKDLTLVDLRILAKELKLTKYHKLRKEVLFQKVVGKLDSC